MIRTDKVIKAEIEELEEKIEPIRVQIGRLKEELLQYLSPFQVGDLIQWNSGRGVSTGRVLRLGWFAGDEPMWIVQRIRKNGSQSGICKVYPGHKPYQIERATE